MFYDKINSLEKCLTKLQNNNELQKSMSNNGKKLYDEKFEFNKVYDTFVSYLENTVIKKDD